VHPPQGGLRKGGIRMTGRSIAVIFVASWFLLDPAAARSLARDLDAGAAIGINDRSTSSGITFHGRSLQNGTTELVFQVAGKLILISVQGDAAGGGRRVSRAVARRWSR
jgi:hypothetical protein